MKKVWSLGVLMAAVLLAASLMFGLAPGVAAQGKGPPERFLVFTDGDRTTNDNVHKKAKENSGRVITTFHVKRGLDVLLAEVPGEARKDLAGVKGVLEVSLDIPGELLDVGADELQWGVDRVDADCVWSDTCQANLGSVPRHVHATGTLTGAGVRIAIVDTGIDLEHEDLKANLDLNGDGLVNGNDGHVNCADTPDDTCSTAVSADDGHGHGTHVAGIAAAVDNTVGVIGVAPGAKLLAVEACNENSCTLISVWNGIRYVSNTNSDGTSGGARRADVMNISLGWSKNLSKTCPSCVTTFQTVIDEAWNKGVVTVAAAGNSGHSGGGGDNITYPARLNNVVAVGCTMSNDVRCSFSSTGPALDLAAPGYQIFSTLTPGAYCASCSYGTLSGTSMSSPHTAGAAALVIASGITDANGNGRINDEVVTKLTSTADDLGAGGFDTLYGNGLLDAQEAATLSTALAISSLSASPNPFSPNGDTVKDTTTISFSLNKAASWTVTTKDGAGNTVKTFSGSTSGAATVSVTWNGTKSADPPGVVGDGAYTVSVSATAGPETASASTSVTVDNTAPALSNVAAGNITGSSADITWNTNESSDSKVEYGTTSGSYPTSVYDGALVTSHKFSLTNLNSSTIYFYRATSADAAGNKAVSAEQSFTTGAASTVVFADNFEGTINWTASGLWHLANNTGCIAPNNGYTSATRSFYYGREDTCNYDTGIKNSGTLASPTIGGLVAGTATATLSFNYWREVELFTGGSFDKTYVQVSYDGGVSWTTVWFKDSKNTSEKAWTPVSISLNPGSDTMYLRFVFDTADHIANKFRGWLIDDVKVEKK